MPARPVDVRLTGPRERSCVVFLSRLDGGEGGDGDLMLHFIDVDRAEESRSAVRAVAEDAGDRTARRRRRA